VNRPVDRTAPVCQPLPGFPEIPPPALYGFVSGDRVIYEGIFVNNGVHSACIVAVVDFRHGQWAAYMAGVDGDLGTDEAMLKTAATGTKVPERFGTQCFAELPATLWRK
jgi:hypothetical protein